MALFQDGKRKNAAKHTVYKYKRKMYCGFSASPLKGEAVRRTDEGDIIIYLLL